MKIRFGSESQKSNIYMILWLFVWLLKRILDGLFFLDRVSIYDCLSSVHHLSNTYLKVDRMEIF